MPENFSAFVRNLRKSYRAWFSTLLPLLSVSSSLGYRKYGCNSTDSSNTSVKFCLSSK